MVPRSLFAIIPLFLLSVSRPSPIWGVQAADPAKPLTLQQVWSLDSTYTDRQNGVSFRYPSIWKPETQFGYVPPGLIVYLEPSGDERLQRVKGFAYEEGGFPRDRIIGPYSATNLEGFGFVYSVLPAASPADCEKKASSAADNPIVKNSGHRSVRIAGRSYSVYTTAGEAMNQTYDGQLYGTYAGNACYLFETGVATALPGILDNIQALTPAQFHSIDVHLWQMMETVRISRQR